jgi:hypothetical protein
MEPVVAFFSSVSELFGRVGLFLASLAREQSALLRDVLWAFFLLVGAAGILHRKRQGAILCLVPMSLALLLVAQLHAAQSGAPPRTSAMLLTLAYLQAVIVSVAASFFARRQRKQPEAQPATPSPQEGGVPSGRLGSLDLPTCSFLAFLLACAIPIRLWEFTTYPEFFGWEFEGNGWRVLRVLEGQSAFLTVLHFWDGQYLAHSKSGYALITDAWALLFRWLGAGITTMKVLPTLLGLAAVVLTWLVGRAWFGRCVGATAGLLVAVSPYMIGMSRDLWSHVWLLVPYSLVTVHCLLLSMERPAASNVIGTAFLAALSLHLYQAAYILPVIVGCFWGIQVLRDRKRARKNRTTLLIGLALAVLVAAPPFYLSFSTKFSGRYTSHVRGSAAPAYTDRPVSEILLQNGKDTWRHLVYDGTPLAFNGGIRTHNQEAGSVHLPPVAALFFTGLGLILTTARRRRSAQVVLSLLILGMLPAFLSNDVRPRRLILIESAYFLMAAVGVVGAWNGLRAVLPGRLRWASWVLGTAASLGILCVGWGTFVAMSKQAPPDYHRRLSEDVARGVKEEMSVMFFGPTGSRRTIQVLSWDGLKLEDVQRRCLYVENDAQLEDVQPLPGLKTARFVFRADRISLPHAEEMFRQQAQSSPTWEFVAPNLGEKREAEHYLWFKAPIRDFARAKNFARRVLIAEVTGGSEKDPQAVREGREEGALQPRISRRTRGNVSVVQDSTSQADAPAREVRDPAGDASRLP